MNRHQSAVIVTPIGYSAPRNSWVRPAKSVSAALCAAAIALRVPLQLCRRPPLIAVRCGRPLSEAIHDHIARRLQ